MWQPELPPLAIFARVAILYLSLFAMMRFAGKREVGQLSPTDLLGILLLSETVSASLNAQDTSLTGGLIAAASVLVVSAAVSRVAYHSRWAERWIEGTPSRLIEDGKLVAAAARSERITIQELEAALRREGLERVEQVALAVVETNGTISIIPRDERQ